MKSRRRSRPPPSSSHAPSETPPVPVNIDELSSRLGLLEVLRSSESHISLLPAEILAEIFTYCVPPERFPHISNTSAPVVLTHVSSYWRALALSLPGLWSSVHIAYRNAVDDIPAIEALLSRSGNRPLALSIAIDFAEQPQEEILAVLQGHSRRWKNVRFDFRHLLCPPVYSLQQAVGAVPQLETFEFHATDISDVNLAPVTQLLRSAPTLRELAWIDDLADIDTLLQLPLARLTHLALSIEHGTLDYLQVLRECSNLEHIRLTRPRPRAPAVQAQAPLFLAKLTSLNISSDMLGILDNLVLPALKEVRIYGDRKPSLPRASGHNIPYPSYPLPAASHVPQGSSQGVDSASSAGFDATALLSLVDRSLCAITSLSVKAPMAEDMLMRCLARTSRSLVHLSVDGAQAGDKLLQALTWRRDPTHTQARQVSLRYGSLSPAMNRKSEGGLDGLAVGREPDSDLDEGGGRLCPKLEELEFDSRVVCSQGMLASMIESRVMWPGPSGSSAWYRPANGPGQWLAAGIDQEDSGLDATLVPLRKLRVVDGHRDLERLKELSVLSRTHCKALVPLDRRLRVPMRRSWTEGNFRKASTLQARAPLTLVVVPVPQTSKTRPSVNGLLFRRKLCASR